MDGDPGEPGVQEPAPPRVGFAHPLVAESGLVEAEVEEPCPGEEGPDIHAASLTRRGGAPARRRKAAAITRRCRQVKSRTSVPADGGNRSA